MADGLSPRTWRTLADALQGRRSARIASTYVQLHTGAPGAVGTESISSVTTREPVTWTAAAGGAWRVQHAHLVDLGRP